MKAEISHSHQPFNKRRRAGFTLMETVIAILVLAILLTGFLTVFTPAAQGIKKSINTQQADRLASSLVRDMAKLNTEEAENPDSDIETGFDKAFTWIKEANNPEKAILVYQYRGWNPSSDLSDMPSPNPRADGTLAPMTSMQGKPGIDYIVQSVARRIGDNDTNLEEDLRALVGPIFYVKPTQLYPEDNELKLGDIGDVVYFDDSDPPQKTVAATPSDYPDAIITFSAAFYSIPAASLNYLNSNKFTEKFESQTKPIFVRNLAVRR